MACSGQSITGAVVVAGSCDIRQGSAVLSVCLWLEGGCWLRGRLFEANGSGGGQHAWLYSNALLF